MYHPDIPPFGGWRCHLFPQFGEAAKGKRLNGQARRLTSPHLEVLCRTSTGDYGGESHDGDCHSDGAF